MASDKDRTLYRGDWILEHLAAIYTNQIQPIDMTTQPYNPKTPGAYIAEHGYYDADLLPTPQPHGPRFYRLHIPAERRIQQPTETHTTTHAWAKGLTQQLAAIDALRHFHAWLDQQDVDREPLAHYDNETQSMQYGPHPQALKRAVHIASASLQPPHRQGQP